MRIPLDNQLAKKLLTPVKLAKFNNSKTKKFVNLEPVEKIFEAGEEDEVDYDPPKIN